MQSRSYFDQRYDRLVLLPSFAVARSVAMASRPDTRVGSLAQEMGFDEDGVITFEEALI